MGSSCLSGLWGPCSSSASSHRLTAVHTQALRCDQSPDLHIRPRRGVWRSRSGSGRVSEPTLSSYKGRPQVRHLTDENFTVAVVNTGDGLQPGTWLLQLWYALE